MSNVRYVGKLHEPIRIKKTHFHAFYEVVYYTSGTGLVELDGETVPFSPSDIFVIPPRVEHSDYAENGFQNYHYEFEDSTFPYTKWIKFRDTESGDFLGITEKLYREYQLKRTNYREIVDGLYTVLYNYILSFYGEKRYSPPVEFAVNEIVDNFSDTGYDFSVTQKKISLNTDYFRRQFVRETGKTPLQYLTEMRVNHAKHLLALRPQSHLSVQDIAFLSGFSDSLYFSRVFKNATGIPPKQWEQGRNEKSRLYLQNVNEVRTTSEGWQD